MTKGHLEKRVSDLEETMLETEQPKKVFLLSHFDFKDHLKEIENAKSEGQKVMLICFCGPDDHDSDTGWGEFLRRNDD